MQDADLKTAIQGDSSNNGSFTINGVAISYNTSSDSIQNVLDRINSSSAGVTATFDSQNGRFVLTNNTTGNVGISMQDETGNFLAATGLASGQFASGQNLLYTLNGGSQVTDQPVEYHLQRQLRHRRSYCHRHASQQRSR